MEPNREAHRVTSAAAANRRSAGPSRWFAGSGPELRVLRRQAGITAIGFLILAALFGIVGFAGLRLVPMYIQRFTLSKVLDDVQHELDGQGATSAGIRSALGRRFDIEGIDLPSDDVKISQVRDGYQVQIQYENRAHYIADIWLVVVFDKQVQIRR
jgi:hypothetical protein